MVKLSLTAVGWPQENFNGGVTLESGGRAGAPLPQKDWENRVSRNSPSLAVALNCGIGSNSLNAEVKGVGETPDGSQFKLLVSRLEVKVMHGPRQMFWSFKVAFHERFVDDDFCPDIGEFAPLPCLCLLSHRLKVPLHPIHSDRHAIDQRERLRVFGKYRRKHARDNVAKLSCDM